MSNYKVLVRSEIDRDQAIGLFQELGYFRRFQTPRELHEFVCTNSDMKILCSSIDDGEKEITLPELRDLVVLKRNDPKDASHKSPIGTVFYVSTDSKIYYFNEKWCESHYIFSTDGLKPIDKKEMKEYLVKSQDGKWREETDLVGDPTDTVIEIPEGAEVATKANTGISFWKDSGVLWWCRTENKWFKHLDLNHNIEKCGHEIIWQRHTHPEELPFIDDEPLLQTATGIDLDQVAKNNDLRELLNSHTQSLNDQYAEIEKVRQSAWQKQEGGSHYKNLKIQPMQYALENKLDYAQANVVKYVTRHADKNGKEDLLKAIHNLELMIEFYYGDEK